MQIINKMRKTVYILDNQPSQRKIIDTSVPPSNIIFDDEFVVTADEKTSSITTRPILKTYHTTAQPCDIMFTGTGWSNFGEMVFKVGNVKIEKMVSIKTVHLPEKQDGVYYI